MKLYSIKNGGLIVSSYAISKTDEQIRIVRSSRKLESYFEKDKRLQGKVLSMDAHAPFSRDDIVRCVSLTQKLYSNTKLNEGIYNENKVNNHRLDSVLLVNAHFSSCFISSLSELLMIRSIHLCVPKHRSFHADFFKLITDLNRN